MTRAQVVQGGVDCRVKCLISRWLSVAECRPRVEPLNLGHLRRHLNESVAIILADCELCVT